MGISIVTLKREDGCLLWYYMSCVSRIKIFNSNLLFFVVLVLCKGKLLFIKVLYALARDIYIYSALFTFLVVGRTQLQAK